MERIVSRVLLLTGSVFASDQSLRRRILRFTGSRRATRAILRRIEQERQRGPLLSCLIARKAQTDRDGEGGWLVGFSLARAALTDVG